MSDIKCTRCSKYRKDFDVSKNRFIHSCAKFKTITVYGELMESINPECVSGDFVSWPKIESLKDKTFILAGGRYDRATEKERSGLKDIKGWRPLIHTTWNGR